MHAYGRWRALAPAAPEPVPVRRARAGTRYGLAVLAVDQGDATAARPLLERNLAILGELGDEPGRPRRTSCWRWWRCSAARWTRRALPAEGRALSRELGDQSGISRQLNMAGLPAHMGGPCEGGILL